MSEFNDLEKNLLRFLKAEYLEKGTAPSHLSAPATFHRDVMAKFALSLPQYREIMARFEVLGIAQAKHPDAHNGCVHIYPFIVEVVRQFDHPQPDGGSKINILYVNEMVQSNIQQGTTGSIQGRNISGSDLVALSTLLAEFRKGLPQLALSEDDEHVATEDLDTIQRQIASPRPNRGIIRESLRSLRTIAEGAAGDAVGAGLVSGIAQLWASF